MTHIYKTREEAIEAAKLLLETDSNSELEPLNTNHQEENCWCCPEIIKTPNGTITVHREKN